MKGVLEASEELRRAANELLPRLGAMCVLHPEDEPAFWSEEELRGSPAGMLAKRYHISTPRTHVGGGGAEAGGGKGVGWRRRQLGLGARCTCQRFRSISLACVLHHCPATSASCLAQVLDTFSLPM